MSTGLDDTVQDTLDQGADFLLGREVSRLRG
jgi:hypothetical protein